MTHAAPTSLVDFAEWVRSLPLESFAPLGILLIAGIVLLAFGQRLLKPVLLFAAVFAGVLIANRLGHATQSSVSPLVWSAGGAVAGFLAVLVSYRLALGLAMASIGGVAAILIATAAAEMGFVDVGGPRTPSSPNGPTAVAHEPDDQADRIVAAAEATVAALGTEHAPGAIASELDRMSPGLGPAVTAWIDRCQGMVASVSTWAGERWSSLTPPMRTLLSASGAAGAFLGFVAGITSPVWAAALVTSLFGSLLTVLCGLPVLSRFLPADSLPSSPLAWLAAWLGLALAGALFQWVTRQRKSQKKAAERARTNDRGERVQPA